MKFIVWTKTIALFIATIVYSTIGATEIMLASGLVLIAYGLSMVYLPAAYFVPGSVLTIIAVYGVFKSSRGNNS